jgi:Asp-tRNA(Asn)/Glu-tRNA(Gln) amidotransferase A subunit family amidase
MRTATTIDELAFVTLREAVRDIRKGRFTAEELTAACIGRIRAFDDRVRAWAWFDANRALEHARAADRVMRAGTNVGPLHGTGIGLKDIIHARGLPTGMGSPIFADCVADRSAACVEKLEAAGAFILGKTATCEFATQHPPSTTNPWNAEFTPGGSSSGSAAAVAAGFVTAALGSQTRGSTIRPAVYCGIVGFKPSFGRISRVGVLETSATLDQAGIFARSLDDAWLLTHVLQGPDVRDPATLQENAWQGGDEPIAVSPAPPRLAAVRTPAWDKADAAQRALFESNCNALREAGARVEHVELPEPFAAADDATRVIQLAEIARNFADLYERAKDRMSGTFRTLVERGARIPAADYQHALEVQRALQQSFAQFVAGYDAIVTPPATGEAPRTLRATGDASFCVIWTLCGVPSVAFPVALGPQRMPMGLQLVGAHGKDREVLEIASWCRAVLPFDARLMLDGGAQDRA